MTRVKLERYSDNVPRAVRQGWDVRGFIKRQGDWIGSDSETVRRYRTLPHTIKEVYRLSGQEAAYHPFVVRDKRSVIGLATVHSGRGVRHPELPHPITGTDIDYNLMEHASDEQHLSTVRALLHATGSLALGDTLRTARKDVARPDDIVDWQGARHQSARAAALAVVPVHQQDNRLRGFELARDAGLMERVEGPASLAVPEEYAHPYIDVAKGGQQVQLYLATELPFPRNR